MRSIMVSTSVFARIWANRRSGEETENEILERLLTGEPDKSEESVRAISEAKAQGLYERKYGVRFDEGFEIFRNYLGTDFTARVVGAGWVLANTGQSYRSLNELSKAVGAKIENAWMNWFFRGADGSRQPISVLRDPSKIVRRERKKIDTTELLAGLNSLPDTPSNQAMEKPMRSGDATWTEILAKVGLGYEGPQHRSAWIRDAEKLARQLQKSVPSKLEQTLQQAFQRNCAGSRLCTSDAGDALFFFSEGKGAGYWAVNRKAAENYRAKRGRS